MNRCRRCGQLTQKSSCDNCLKLETKFNLDSEMENIKCPFCNSYICNCTTGSITTLFTTNNQLF